MNNSNNTVEINGSSKIVSDYFEICIHNILFQRKIYSRDQFKVIRKFGLNVVYSNNPEIVNYIKLIIKQLNNWIFNQSINWLTLLIVSKEDDSITEKWMFHIDINNNNYNDNTNTTTTTTIKPLETIQLEIQSIIKQISSSITFLPVLTTPQTFKILVHTIGDIKSNNNWDDAKFFKEIDENESESVEYNNLTTNNHKISTYVTYKTID
ncbi:spindle checkpoint protein [Pichia kluyveri]|uniref:Spindle checkpoint protein n=1 Tax=Pichia kluyveri TaxID=36015 RepID=A0AAV5QWT9_PICKL|nr:spindle checkpoint protein [Pichia kluyveri]